MHQQNMTAGHPRAPRSESLPGLRCRQRRKESKSKERQKEKKIAHDELVENIRKKYNLPKRTESTREESTEKEPLISSPSVRTRRFISEPPMKRSRNRDRAARDVSHGHSDPDSESDNDIQTKAIVWFDQFMGAIAGLENTDFLENYEKLVIEIPGEEQGLLGEVHIHTPKSQEKVILCCIGNEIQFRTQNGDNILDVGLSSVEGADRNRKGIRFAKIVNPKFADKKLYEFFERTQDGIESYYIYDMKSKDPSKEMLELHRISNYLISVLGCCLRNLENSHSFDARNHVWASQAHLRPKLSRGHKYLLSSEPETSGEMRCVLLAWTVTMMIRNTRADIWQRMEENYINS